MTATFYVGDAVTVMAGLPAGSVDLVLTSPPFLALRSYLPADHPDKNLEGGSQSTPGAYIDWLLDVVEACARILAPHGSLCFELGDTYSGSGGAGGDYAAEGLRDGQPRFKQRNDGGQYGYYRPPENKHNVDVRPLTGGNGWPLAKSLSLIPESFRWAMVYGRNPFTGRTCDTWRLRNVIRWVRPNPPVGALGDKFRPATSELMVFCKAKDRFFDLDAVRTAEFTGHSSTKDRSTEKHQRTSWGNYDQSQSAGAPPLDWWNIPPGGYSGFTTRTVRVPIDPATFDGFSGDIQRTVSADCPEHGDQADQAPKGSHGGRGEIESLRNLDIDGRHVGPLTGGFFPTDQLPLLNPEDGSSDSPHPRSTPAATRRSKASNRTVPVPATSPPDTASDKTRRHIADTSTEPPTGEPHPDTPENRTSEASSGEAPLGTPGRIADTKTERSDEACTCSYFVEKANNTSHYAVWPPELLIKPVKAMCPEKVCRVCGEPSRRIVEADYAGATWPSGGSTNGLARQPERVDLPYAGRTTGFSDCSHDDWRPGVVLDPFGGSGTTALVATGHGRDCILIDLDSRNFDLALDRVGPFILNRGDLESAK